MIKNKKKKNPFLIIIIFFIFLISFIIFFPLIAIYSSPYIIKKVFDRELRFKSAAYSPLKASIEIKQLTLSAPDGLKLFDIKRMYIAVSIKKLFMLQPVVTSIIIEDPKTFLEKKAENKYLFPEYLKMGKKEKKKDLSFNLPFSFEEIIVKDGVIGLKEKGKYKDLLSEVNIIIPGIKNAGDKKEAEPVISGKFFGESFRIKGKSRLDNQALVNTFIINLNKFKIDRTAKYIPAIRNIKILSGIITSNINITFTTYKNKRSSLLLVGNIEVRNLDLYDTWINTVFLEDAGGIIKIERYDFLNKIFDISDIFINNGKLMLSYSNNEKEKSTFFVKKKKSIYKTHINRIETDNMKLLVTNKNNDEKYSFNNMKISANDFYNYKSTQIDFNIDAAAYGIEKISGSGFVNYKEKTAKFNVIRVSKLDLNKFRIIPQKKNTIKSCIIDKFEGSIELSQKETALRGESRLKDIKIELNKKRDFLEIINAEIDIDEYLVRARSLSINSFSCLDANLVLNNEGKSLKKITFFIPNRNVPYNLIFENNDKINRIKDDFKINKVSGEYDAQDVNFTFKISQLRVQPDVKFNFASDEKINGSSLLELDELFLYDHEKPVLKIDKVSTAIESIKYKPLYINLSTLSLDSPNFEMTIKKDKKLYVFSLLKLKADNTNKDVKINIDKILFSNGTISFEDYSLNKPLKIDVNKLEGEIKNYPSTVYPGGQISISGLINGRNIIKIDSSISNALGIKGKLKSNDILLPLFTPYTEKFINYSISGGFLDISSDYEINRDKVNISFDLALKNTRFIKVGPDKNEKDLSKIIPQLEDSDGKIVVSMPPIKGKWDSPEFDFRSAFFDIFLEMLSNSGKNIMPTFDRFRPDDTVDIIYFKAGRSDFLLNEAKIFSDKMLEMLKNKNKYFVIEGYADKDKDAANLKEAMLLEMMEKFSSNIPEKGSDEEKEILKQIYLQVINELAPEDMTGESMKSAVLDKMIVSDARYFALSYARIKKVKDLLIKNYNIKPEKIGSVEKDIFINPYISGVGNSIVVLKSGAVRE